MSMIKVINTSSKCVLPRAWLTNFLVISQGTTRLVTLQPSQHKSILKSKHIGFMHNINYYNTLVQNILLIWHLFLLK